MKKSISFLPNIPAMLIDLPIQARLETCAGYELHKRPDTPHQLYWHTREGGRYLVLYGWDGHQFGLMAGLIVNASGCCSLDMLDKATPEQELGFIKRKMMNKKS